MMRCILCDRPLTSAALTLPSRTGPRAIGPKCAKKAGLIKPKQRVRKADAHERCAETVDWVEGVTA